MKSHGIEHGNTTASTEPRTKVETTTSHNCDGAFDKPVRNYDDTDISGVEDEPAHEGYLIPGVHIYPSLRRNKTNPRRMV